MFKTRNSHVVIGGPVDGRRAWFDSLLFPNGERALWVSRSLIDNALISADETFEEAANALRGERDELRGEPSRANTVVGRR